MRKKSLSDKDHKTLAECAKRIGFAIGREFDSGTLESYRSFTDRFNRTRTLPEYLGLGRHNLAHRFNCAIGCRPAADRSFFQLMAIALRVINRGFGEQRAINCLPEEDRTEAMALLFERADAQDLAQLIRKTILSTPDAGPADNNMGGDGGETEVYFGDGSYMMHGRYYVPAAARPPLRYPIREDI